MAIQPGNNIEESDISSLYQIYNLSISCYIKFSVPYSMTVGCVLLNCPGLRAVFCRVVLVSWSLHMCLAWVHCRGPQSPVPSSTMQHVCFYDDPPGGVIRCPHHYPLLFLRGVPYLGHKSWQPLFAPSLRHRMSRGQLRTIL